MITAGHLLLVVGILVCLVGEVMLLTVAYKRGLGWFFGCLFIPPVWIALLMFHFGAAIRPVALASAGVALCYLGASMAGLEI